MTRSAGSVPEGRTSTRPPAPRRASASAIARRRTGSPSHCSLCRTRTARCSWGRSGIRSASSARRRPLVVTTRRTSSAVTSPSPEVVCSRTITWPLFSPPRPGAGDLHALEDVLVADRRPDDRAAGLLDRLLQPAVREHGDDERADRRIGRVRAGAATAAPARARRGSGRRRRRCPAPSTATSRSASPSSANPRSAPVSRDARRERRRIRRAAVEVDVQPVRLVVDHLDLRARRADDPAGDRATPSRSRSRRRSAARTRRSCRASPSRWAT